MKKILSILSFITLIFAFGVIALFVLFIYIIIAILHKLYLVFPNKKHEGIIVEKGRIIKVEYEDVTNNDDSSESQKSQLNKDKTEDSK